MTAPTGKLAFAYKTIANLTEENRALRAELSAIKASGEAVAVSAVATVNQNADGDLRLDWLLEGGICELFPGTVLVVPERPITDDEGCGEVYTRPPVVAEAEPVDMAGKIVVSSEPLRQLLQALINAPHEIRELQATREPAELFADNPINLLVAEFNAAIDTAE